MPSSVSFLIHSNSNLSSENDNNNMLEYSSDHHDSDSQDDDIDNNTNKQQSSFLTRQVVPLDDNWTMKKSRNENKFTKPVNQGEATLLEMERDETPFLNSNQHEIFSPDKSRSVDMVDNKQQANDTHIFSPDEFDTNIQNVHSIPKWNNTQPSSLPIRTKTNIIPSPKRTSTLPTNKITNVDTRRPIPKNPIRSNSASQSRSRSPARTINKRQISSPTTNKGAFHFFLLDDHQTSKQNTSLSKDDRKRITNSDDDDDSETDHLKEDDLKLKLKQEKRHGKITGELLNKLHENYEELLEKYAQAENTIDQLRFQPRFFDNNTPRSTISEHQIHFTQQSKVNLPTLRSSGAYHSTTGSPFSSIRPVPSTTTTTPARKSISPTNSAAIESVYFDEVIPRKNSVHELKTPETWKFDLLVQTQTLREKMKAFLTLMDANQLSLAEQKQIYESITQDYGKLIEIVDQNKHDIEADGDLNKELEMMKQLLKEIVKKMTQNLLVKSVIDSPSERQTHNSSHSSQLSLQSSLFNHNDLMDQYENLLNTVNTNRRDSMKFVTNQFETDSSQLKFDVSDHQQPTNNKQKPYVYISGDSDDEQQQSDGITPIQYTKSIESTSFDFDYIPSTSVKQHQHKIEGQTHNLKSKRRTKIEEKVKKLSPNKISNDSSPLIPTRYSNSRTNDSGIGTNNLTKVSYDSKLYTSTMDESHFQSLDDEQESISSTASSRSSDSGSVSPGSPYRKKFDNRSSYRRKPSGHSNSYQSDIEQHINDPFDLLSPSSSYKKKMPSSYRTRKPQKTSISHRSRLLPIHRTTTIESPSIEDYKMKSRRPLTTPQISSKININHRQTIPPTYRSSIYINQIHTNKGLQDKIDQNLYLDPQTGIVYRCESNKNPDLTRIYYEPSSQTKLYRCAECGTTTTYHHRHHGDSPSRLVRTPSDDLGYESGYKKRNRRYRYTDYSSSSSSSSSSDSDSDISSSYRDMIALNQAYNRAEKVQYRSRCLSKYVIRQLKLAFATL